MKPEIAYVYNKLKQLRFDFKKTDFDCFRENYRYESTLKRYVRKDDNDLFIDKNTFKPLEEELEYADKCHNLEEQIGCPLDVFVKLVLRREVWAETPEMHFEEGNYGSLVDSQKWEDRHCCRVDADFDIDDDNLGDTVFWAWYDYCCNGSDHVELKLSDHGKLWWLEKDKSE